MYYSKTDNNQISCLVYGGSGFIGYHLTKLLLDQQCQVYSLDNFSLDRFENSKQLSASGNYYHFSQDLDQFDFSQIPNIDYVFSLIGAELSLNDIEGNVYKYIKNSFFTQALLDISISHNAKFLFLSADKSHTNFTQTQDEQYKQEIVRVAQNHAEKLVSHYKNDKQLNARIVRTAYLYGPKINIDSSSYIAYIVKNIFQKQKIELPGDGMESLYPTYVEDLVLGIAKAMFSQSTSGKIFNLINPDSKTLLNFVYTLKDLFDIQFEILFKKELNQHLEEPDQRNKNAQNLLGWQAKTTLETGLEKTIFDLQTRKQIPLIINLKTKTSPSTPLPATKKPIPTQLQPLNALQPKLAQTNNSIFSTIAKKTPVPTISYPSPTIRPSVVTNNFSQRLKLLIPKFGQKKSFSQPPGFSSGKIFYFLGPALLLLFIFFAPRIYLQLGIKFFQKKLDKIENNINNKHQDSTTEIKTVQKQYQRLFQASQLVSWQNNIIDKNFNQETQFFLEFGPKISSLYQNLNQINLNYQKLKQIILGSQIENAQDSYQNIASNLEQGIDTLNFLFTQIEKRQTNQAFKNKIELYKSQLEAQQKVVNILPGIFHFQDKAQILVLIQDNLELRPTGGFVSAVGILTVEKGKILDFNIQDIYQVDSNLKGKITPPEEFQKYQLETNWFFRDVNFSPNFSCQNIDIEKGQHCTAGDAIWFAKQTLGVEPQSVIAINLNTLAQLSKSLGEISLPDYNETIDTYNLLEKAKVHAQTNENSFIVALTQAFFDKLKNTDSYQFSDLLLDLDLSLENADTLIYLFNSPYQAKVEEYGWAGSLRQSPTKLVQFGQINISDYLAIYESNFSYRKNNYYTQNSLKHQIDINPDGQIAVTSIFTIQNNAATQTWPSGNYDKNYLRFILPQNAILKSIHTQLNQQEAKALKSKEVDRKEEGVYRSIGFLTSIPVKGQMQITLNYQLKDNLFDSSAQSSYALYLQKQPGSYDSNYEISFNLPQNIKVEKISPTPQTLSTPISFSGILDRDKVFVLTFQAL